MADVYRLEPAALGNLFGALRARGYQAIGPTRRDGAIVHDDLSPPGDLPVGWTDEQEGGHYRLKKRDDDAYFGFVVGPQSWKKYLHPPVLSLWRAKRSDDGFEVEEPADAPPRYAFIGVRAVEILYACDEAVRLIDLYTALRALNPDVPVFELSCRTGEGVAAWTTWLARQPTSPVVSTQ